MLSEEVGIGVGVGVELGVGVAVAEGLDAGGFEFAGGGVGGEGGGAEGVALGVVVVAVIGTVGVPVGVAVSERVRVPIAVFGGVPVAVVIGNGPDGVRDVVCSGDSISGAHTHHPSRIRILNHDHHPNPGCVVTAKQRCAAQPSWLCFGYRHALLAVAVPPVPLSVSTTCHAAEVVVRDHGGVIAV